jgi:ribosomal protein S18 acetylase RimI-like enzyme
MTPIKGKRLEIKPITENDLAAVLAVYRQCEDFLALGPEPHASLEMVLGDLEISQTEGGSYCGIHDPQGKMIGIIDFVPQGFEGNPHHAFISLLMIAPPFRRQGLGREVVNMVEGETMKNAQVEVIFSAVQENNPAAIRFWQNNGYQITSGPELRPDQTTVFHLRKDIRVPKIPALIDTVTAHR